MDKKYSFEKLIKNFRKKKVLIIGDVMLDAYIYGKVGRISPEAPVPIVNVTKREKRLGGAANVALNVLSLGAQPYLCSVVGADDEGEAFCSLLEKNNIHSEGILKSEERITTIKNRILSHSQHLLRIDSETEQPLSTNEKEQLTQKIATLLDVCDLVIMEDYDKGCLDKEIIDFTISKANKQKKKTAVDPKKKHFLAYNHCTLFKPNLKEMSEGMGIDVNPKNLESLQKGVHTLHSNINAHNILVTLSEHGIYFHTHDANGIIPAHIRQISDVSGAGDTVISVAALTLDDQVPLPYVAALSNLAGGIVCEQQGVVPIDLDKLTYEAKQDEMLRRYFNF